MAINPISSISGNGVSGQVVTTYTTGSTTWNIVTRSLPGLAGAGTFPNNLNLNTIVSQNFNFILPFRGGKNLPSTNTRVLIVDQLIGISSIGTVFNSPDSGILVSGGAGITWRINSVYTEIFGDDQYGSSPNAQGVYNSHDSRSINGWSTITGSTWSSSLRQSNGHSKIVGWAADGYPIYGPYGYINPRNSASGTARMVSGYSYESKGNRPAERSMIVSAPITSLSTFDVYSANGITVGMKLTSSSFSDTRTIIRISGRSITINQNVTLAQGATIRAVYSIGTFLEDYTYRVSTSTVVLDNFNGRYCITPDYPEGTYAYFMTEDSSGVPQYPYIVGPYFYGNADSDSNDSRLSNLIPSVGTIAPAFISTITNYTVTVSNTTTNIKFTPFASNVYSTIVVNTATVVSGTITQAWPLIVGNNIQTIKVTSQYVTTSTYTITVNRVRSPLKNLTSLTINKGSISFDPAITFYSIVLPSNNINITVTAVAQSQALSTILINGSSVISGTPFEIPLYYGVNAIIFTVTAEDTTTKLYYLFVTRLSTISLLDNLDAQGGVLFPSFDTGTFLYSLPVSNATTSTRVRAVVTEDFSTLSVNGVAVTSGSYSNSINLNLGITPIRVSVISSDRSTEHFYQINVNRAFSNNTALSSLSISTGTLTPGFSQYSTSYTATVQYATSQIYFNVGLASADQSVTVNGISISTSGSNYSIFGLDVGVNQFTLVVTAQNKIDTRTFYIAITRVGSLVSTLSNLAVSKATLTPGFSETIYNYTGTVFYSTISTDVIPTGKDSNASITVNSVSALSGKRSQSIPLTVGTNTIRTTVISQSGLTSSTYTVSLFRKANYDASLSLVSINTGILVPEFDPTVLTYSVTQPHTVTDLEVTPYANDSRVTSIRIGNGTVTYSTVTSGTVTLPLTGYIGSMGWYGYTAIKINITAADSVSTQTYTLNVTRKPSTVSTLSNLTTNLGPLNPTFSPYTTEYFYSVPFIVTSTNITATLSDPLSTAYINSNIGINNTDIAISGVPKTVPLFVGNNAIPIVVFANDNSYYTAYNVYINRSASGLSTNALLSDISVSTGTFSKVFNSTVFNYSLTLPFESTNLNIIASKQQTGASIKVNGEDVVSGQRSQNIIIPAGLSTISVVVTAQDRSTKNTYTIQVRRIGSIDSSLKDIQVSVGQLDRYFSKDVRQYVVNLPNYVKQISIKPIPDNNQEGILLNGLAVDPEMWTPLINLNVGNNVSTLFVRAGDEFHESIYQINFIRAKAGAIDPTSLFLNNGSENLVATLVDGNSLLRIHTKVDTSVITIGTFQSPPELQDLTVYYPYSGGQNTPADIVTYRDQYSMIGMTVVGIPIYSPTSNVKIPGLNGTQWTLDRAESVYFGLDQYGGITSELGYHYVNGAFIYNGGWADTPTWGDDFVHDDGHSRIIGFAMDGYPIYGRFGYSNPVNSYSTVTSMISKYVLTTSTNRPPASGPLIYTGNEDDLLRQYELESVVNAKIGMKITGGPIPPETNTFILEVNTLTNTITLDQSIYMSPFAATLTGTYPVGTFIEDYKYDPTILSTLDIHNGRYGVTPDYPYGTYAYFSTTSGSTFVQETGFRIENLMNFAGQSSVQLNSLRVGLGNPQIGPFLVNCKIVFNGGYVSTITAATPVGSPGFGSEWILTGNWPANASGAPFAIETFDYIPAVPNTLKTSYPYFVGTTFYGSTGVAVPAPTDPPVWRTLAGFITTATEGVSMSKTVQALGTTATYIIISGELPPGLSFNNASGIISGIPSLVYQTIRSEFIIRARNQYGVADRKFYIDVNGATPPVIVTPGPKFAVGPSGEKYLVNRQYADFQFSATADIIPAGKSITFYIEDGDGQLPPGLVLSSSGRLYGQVTDDLKLPYRAASDGKYDKEGYDSTPYEHVSTQAYGIGTRFINKIYKFFITASNGVGFVKAEYEIDVYDPTYFYQLLSGPSVAWDGSSYVGGRLYPIAPQWLTSTNLGSVRSNTRQTIELETYDCDPGGGNITYDWYIVNGNNFDLLPPGLTLDSSTGVLQGYIKYTAIYTTVYTFKIRVVKHNLITSTDQYRDKTFTLTVLGSVISKMTFETPSFIGSVSQGVISELFIKAVHSDSELGITYSLVSGSLPAGLSLAIDGAIQGRVSYASNITIKRNYTFVVKATDSNLTGELVGTFTIQLLPYEGKTHFNAVLQPFPIKSSQVLFDTFINDQFIFDAKFLYRPYDQEFGVNRQLRFILEYGIELLDIEEEHFDELLIESIQRHFHRKQLQFGELKSAVATDHNGNVVYEVVYVELIDNLTTPDGKTVSYSLTENGITTYPNSIDNMRAEIESVLAYDINFLPRFMRTIQKDTGTPLGRILCLPICYCLPGNSTQIIRRIKNYNIDFKKINFDIDRVIIEDLDQAGFGAKYLLFPRREV